MATIFLSFTCHPVFPHMKHEMVHRSDKRIKKVLRGGIGLDLLIYLIMAVFGYLSVGETQMPDLFIYRDPVDKNSLDIAMWISRFLFLPIILLHIPFNLYVCRE